MNVNRLKLLNRLQQMLQLVRGCRRTAAHRPPPRSRGDAVCLGVARGALPRDSRKVEPHHRRVRSVPGLRKAAERAAEAGRRQGELTIPQP